MPALIFCTNPCDIFVSQLVENNDTSHIDNEPDPNVMRIGWSVMYANMQLGKFFSPLSFFVLPWYVYPKNMLDLFFFFFQDLVRAYESEKYLNLEMTRNVWGIYRLTDNQAWHILYLLKIKLSISIFLRDAVFFCFFLFFFSCLAIRRIFNQSVTKILHYVT